MKASLSILLEALEAYDVILCNFFDPLANPGNVYNQKLINDSNYDELKSLRFNLFKLKIEFNLSLISNLGVCFVIFLFFYFLFCFVGHW